MKIQLLALTLTGSQRAGSRTEANRDTLPRAVNSYLSKRGDLCLGKLRLAIEVSAQEFQNGGRNAIQMPVLEKLGVCVPLRLSADEHSQQGAAASARRYELTETEKRLPKRELAERMPRPADSDAAKLASIRSSAGSS